MMFGGLSFLLNRIILVGTMKDGRSLLSVGKDNNDAALARPGASPMVHNSRNMTGFVWVEADAIEDDDDLRDWVLTAYTWVSQMPVETKKAPAKKATAKAAAKKAVPARKPVAKKAPAKRAARSRA